MPTSNPFSRGRLRMTRGCLVESEEETEDEEGAGDSASEWTELTAEGSSDSEEASIKEKLFEQKE